MFINHYEILGLDRDADLVQITAAWKRLLRQYHPDLNQDDQDATEQTILINKAYEILSDSKKRKKFDRQLDEYESVPSSSEGLDEPQEHAEPTQQGQANEHGQTTAHANGQADKQGFDQPNNTGSFSSATKGKSKKQRYAFVMSVVGIGLGALTAIPIGLFLVWVISGFDPLGIFRQNQNEVVADGQNPEEKDKNETGPSADKESDTNKKKVEVKVPEKITISYAKFGESRQSCRVEKFVEEVANQEGVITTVTTEGLNTTNPVGRPRTLLRVTYQVDGKKAGTLTFNNGVQVNIREAILKHAKEFGKPFEKIEITYALFGKRRNKVRCEEQIAAVASQIDTVVPITTHGLSLRNPSGIVRHELDIEYKVAEKTGKLTLRYGQNVDLRKTILEHANVLDGSYTPSVTKKDADPTKVSPDAKGTAKEKNPATKQIVKTDPTKNDPATNDPKKNTNSPGANESNAPVIYPLTKLPIPAESSVNAAKTKIAEIFKTDYEFAKRAKGTEELSLLYTLATEVMKLAEKEKDPTTLYALLEIAIDIAIESCHEGRALDYIYQLELRFDIDGLKRRVDALTDLRRRLPLAIRDKGRMNAVSHLFRAASKELFRQAIEKERWLDAIDIADFYRGFCIINGEKVKANVLKQSEGLLKKKQNMSLKVARYLQEIDSISNDPEKMLAVGTYLCFTSQKWDKGLPYLGKCNDVKLSAAARADQSVNESRYMSLADQWWDIAHDEDYADHRLATLSRAKYYYWLALDKATGIDRDKIEKRIKDANKVIWGDGFFFDTLNNFISPSTGMRLIQVRNGSFEMGEHQKNIDAFGKYAASYAHEGPRHAVTITKTYYLGQFEVTFDQWFKVMGTQPWMQDTIVGREASFPAIYVSWNDAQEFCKRLSAIDKRKYRLPTEAEWEFACRAGTITRYFSGDGDGTVRPHDWTRETAHDERGYRSGQRVGVKLPNPFGFYDLHGNQYEWCEDSYEADFYKRSPKVDPVNRAKTDWRVCRSGNIYGKVWTGRSASRHKAGLNERTRNIGFRVVMEK